MITPFVQYRVDQVQRSIQVLRETLDRRFSPDEVVAKKIGDIELEVSLLVAQIKKEK